MQRNASRAAGLQRREPNLVTLGIDLSPSIDFRLGF